MNYKRKNPKVAILTYDEIKKCWEEKGEPKSFEMEGVKLIYSTDNTLFIIVPYGNNLKELVHPYEGILCGDSGCLTKYNIEYINDTFELIETE